ncbi:MAG: electron transfer flavoprotein subunit beta/FixA family protein [Sphingobacteriaceae bacterium]|nr:electron transfer flavoprotein subunit beta/FixA family protein [Sphingobacteriaceae bacterium]
MKILVCISNVPDTTTKITFTNENKEFNASGVQFIVNPYDEIALSKAIDLCEGGKGTVTVINVGDSSTEPTIRKALAIGADDAVRIDSTPRDAYFTAFQIAEYAKQNDFNMILCGRESIDYNGAQVAAMIGEFLEIPSVSIIKKLDTDGTTTTIEREIEGGKEIVSLTGKFVASCAEGVAEAKIPNMRGIMSARTKPLAVVAAQEVKLLSKVISFETPTPRGTVKLIEAENAENLINLLHTEAKVI